MRHCEMACEVIGGVNRRPTLAGPPIRSIAVLHASSESIKESLPYFLQESNTCMENSKATFHNDGMKPWEIRKKARLESGLKQHEVAAAFFPKVSRVTVGQWESPPEKGGTSPSSDKLLVLTRLYKRTAGELLGTEIPGSNLPETVGSDKDSTRYALKNIKTARPQNRPVPVISLIRAGTMKEIGDLPHLGEGEVWEAPDYNLGPRGWAHVVEGDSMDDGSEKAIPEGWIIFVDPDLAPKANSYVIAKDVSNQHATFKKLVYDAGRWFLKPLNKQYQAVEIDSPELRVIGVVTEARAPSRRLT